MKCPAAILALQLAYVGCSVNALRFSYRGEFAWSCSFFFQGMILFGVIRIIKLLEAKP